MHFIFSLFTSYPYFELPYDLISWLGLVFLASFIALVIVKFNDSIPIRETQDWILLSFLVVFSVISTLFLGFRFPARNSLEIFNFSFITQPAALMVFSAIPILLAGGLFGQRYAIGLGFLSGLIIGLWDTHNLFTIIEFVGLSMLVTFAIRQRYRSRVFALLRHPAASGVFVPVLFSPFVLLSFFFAASSGEPAARLDYAFTESWPFIIARSIEYMAAGIIAEILYLSKIKKWGTNKDNQPLPWERSLSLKFTVTIFPIITAAFLALLIGDWIAAGLASRKLMEDRLSNLSLIASESLPYFLETGQNLILHYADENLMSMDPVEVRKQFSDWMDSIPFFTDLALYDPNGSLRSQFPDSLPPVLSPVELSGLELAMGGAKVQTVSVESDQKGQSAKIAFIARIDNEAEGSLGVIVGHTNLAINPFSLPAVEAIRALEANEGEGWILDEESRVVFHTDPDKVMDRYFGSVPGDRSFYEQSIPGEVPRYLYVQTASGRPWTVILSVPSSLVQQIALDIAVPLLVALAVIALVVFFLLQVLTSRITSNLNLLAKKAAQISNGDLKHSIFLEDQDEVGQLADAIEQMRLGLISRIDDINSLLVVSQVVASNLEAEQSMEPILRACLKKSACSARVVLYEDEPWKSPSRRMVSFGYGEKTEEFSNLDEVIFQIMEEKNELIVTNYYRNGLLPKQKCAPGSLLAFALRDKKKLLGILWIGFERPQRFADTDLQFFSTLAVNASLSLSNVNLLRSAEVGRQRMEAILNSSPEPILVFDHNLRLLLLNDAALQISSLVRTDDVDSPLEEVLSHKTLIEMISQSHQDGILSREIVMPEGRTFMASVARVEASGREVGKICTLMDISRYKELDTLKSEFVSTVSHDLKYPLTLIKGYTTMLDMLGELTPQQKNYSNKIAEGIEQMTHLVDDILDLTRIESGIGLHISQINLSEFIERVVSLVQPRALQKNIQIIIQESADSSLSLKTDFSLLQQALLNLLENAVKYTPSGGQVEIATRTDNENVVFEIRDNGMGISQVDIPYIFNKFYRGGNKEAFQRKGTGLGLAIVKSIAVRLEGKVWVQSQLGKGSRFYFELPLQNKSYEKQQSEHI